MDWRDKAWWKEDWDRRERRGRVVVVMAAVEVMEEFW